MRRCAVLGRGISVLVRLAPAWCGIVGLICCPAQSRKVRHRLDIKALFLIFIGGVLCLGARVWNPRLHSRSHEALNSQGKLICPQYYGNLGSGAGSPPHRGIQPFDGIWSSSCEVSSALYVPNFILNRIMLGRRTSAPRRPRLQSVAS